MNTRYNLVGAALVLGAAFVGACAGPIVAPGDSPNAAFARTSEGGNATKNQSCTSDNGTKRRTSSVNNGDKNSCVTKPSVAFVKLPADYYNADKDGSLNVRYAKFGADPCVAGFSDQISGGGGGIPYTPMGTLATYTDLTDPTATTFQPLCIPTVGNYNLAFLADPGDFVKASNDARCANSTADGRVRQCVVTKASTALTVVLVPGAYFSDQTDANGLRKVWFVPFSDGCTVPRDLSSGSPGIVVSTVGALKEANAMTLCPSETSPNLRFEVKTGTYLNESTTGAFRCTVVSTSSLVDTRNCVVTGRRSPLSLRER